MKNLIRISAEKISQNHVGENFVVAGYMESVRDHGELVFVDVTNNGVLIQLVFDPLVCDIERIKALRAHSTIKCSGKLERRSEDRINKKIKTGEVELRVHSYQVVSEAEAMPIDSATTNELKLLEFRNIYLRQPDMQFNIKTKARLISAMRSFLDKNDFFDIETPVLTRTTPGGAKDFLTLSSASPSTVYGMSQSPQMFKQLLMTTGLERYYQLAKCFRDETLRSDRQPEFLQLDLEISWADMNQIMAMVEGMIRHASESTSVFSVDSFPTLTYSEAMDKYGCDKPDLRFGLELVDVTKILEKTSFVPFEKVIKSGGVIKSIAIPSSLYSRTERKQIEEKAIAMGAKGLGYFLIEDGVLTSPLTKFLSEDEVAAIIKMAATNIEGSDNNQIIYLLADEDTIVNKVLSQLRLKFGADLGLIDPKKSAFLWVVDFPLFEKKDNGKIGSAHHPFTAPDEEDYELYKAGKLDIFKIKSKSYDLVLNGSEIGGGSVRIHSQILQSEIFELLQLSATERDSLNWFLKLFKYGVPEHAGFALGVDRFVMEALGLSSIRETVAFPKNSFGSCQMTDAPSEIPGALWKEYGLKKI